MSRLSPRVGLTVAGSFSFHSGNYPGIVPRVPANGELVQVTAKGVKFRPGETLKLVVHCAKLEFNSPLRAGFRLSGEHISGLAGSSRTGLELVHAWMFLIACPV